MSKMAVVQSFNIRARKNVEQIFENDLLLSLAPQPRPWPPPQNPIEFLGGFSTIFFFTG
jgi:hypothetical protein